MATILITGGTGLIGRHLTKMILEERPGDRVIILTRNADKASVSPRLRYAHWDPDEDTIDEAVVSEAEAVIHLAGAGIADQRWTPSYRKKIMESRVKGAELLVNTLSEFSNPIQTVISASAIGFYGACSSSGLPFKEEDGAGKGFLAEVCAQWEQSVAPVAALGKRLVCLRTGLVLTPEGGTLAALMRLARYGVAPVLGSGKQIYSWISVQDLCRMYLFMLDQAHLHGVFNAVAPHPVTEKEMAVALADKIKGHHFPLPVPAFILKIALGQVASEIIKSTPVSAEKIQEQGFRFQAATLAEYLATWV